MPVDHYENFPVASFALPRRLRVPIEAIYRFARAADDVADEGTASAAKRLEELAGFEAALDSIERHETPPGKIVSDLASVIWSHALPVQAFRDLLSAFRQDVVKSRYADFGEVMAYCRRSANPVGRLLMHLFRDNDPRHLAYADGLCSSLQLVNFLQDIAVDFANGRVYLPQDELAKAGLSDALLGALMNRTAPVPEAVAMRASRLGDIPVITVQSDPNARWRSFMLGQIERTRRMLQASAPLGLVLKGRIGFETRMIIAGGERILRKLYADPMAPLTRRVTLNAWDWLVMLWRALVKK